MPKTTDTPDLHFPQDLFTWPFPLASSSPGLSRYGSVALAYLDLPSTRIARRIHDGDLGQLGDPVVPGAKKVLFFFFLFL